MKRLWNTEVARGFYQGHSYSYITNQDTNCILPVPVTAGSVQLDLSSDQAAKERTCDDDELLKVDFLVPLFRR